MNPSPCRSPGPRDEGRGRSARACRASRVGLRRRLWDGDQLDAKVTWGLMARLIQFHVQGPAWNEMTN